ncbi:MAG TPA: GNAT family N-acetyltransferase [Bacteroidota bacterium]|nr:GNAT family N-acetyltransferase [Bacteroidota bacterium]
MILSIREATIADCPVIVRFNSKLAEETEHKTLDQDLLTRGVEALLRDPSKGVYYLAIGDGSVVGQMMITYEWSDWRNGTFWWIQSVYVENAARGSGVFRALFDYVHTLATSRTDVCGLRLYVERGNDRAKRTYDRHGMYLSHYEMFEMDFVMPGDSHS